ncbi:hypothetical protein FNV43_RR11330 [Rhamnella rubrinervis]|uniref:Peptidase A1 domain-containing protein n=1 Tax=Rhamnella rubrinervis TaxID=2594499 RepID=A0A8K0MHI5_9ROSA|nr:hypothetical protein FNV43_RR11330 [Rhamnella rubrinervis]
MGSTYTSLFITYYLLLCLSLIVWSLEARDTKAESYHSVQLSSLLPANICSHSTTEPKDKGSLRVVHRDGPCAQQVQVHKSAPTDAQILEQDQYRVNSINSRISKKSIKQTDGTTLPAKSGATIGSGNYIVTVGLGTPKRDLSMIFDTGSDLIWTQCQPCKGSCYSQKEPIFDPSKSSSYLSVSCNSDYCSGLTSATGNTPGCSAAASTCIYGIQYGDQSYSIGYLSQEKITLSASDVFDKIVFGCGQNNRGLFGGSAGLLGLGRDQLSFVQQTAKKYGRIFSYCLPSTTSATGYLTFGKASGNVKYTPLSTIARGQSFYGLNLFGISVGGIKLSIPPSVFSSSGTIIDSGTVITRLPPTAYGQLRSVFRQQMSSYPSTSALSILDTCYDLTNYSKIKIPKISFFFGSGTTVDLDFQGIMYAGSASQVCLAFAANGDDTDVTIFGNVQQKRLEVVYDVGGGRIGFGSAACS